jgi:hypothetical protein
MGERNAIVSHSSQKVHNATAKNLGESAIDLSGNSYNARGFCANAKTRYN